MRAHVCMNACTHACMDACTYACMYNDLSKEVWKLNFRQYGEMKMAQPGRNSDVEKVSREKIRDGERQKREDAGARKGRKVAKHCVFPVVCGSGGSKGRLTKAAGAEVAGQMRHEKLHAVVARSTF